MLIRSQLAKRPPSGTKPSSKTSLFISSCFQCVTQVTHQYPNFMITSTSWSSVAVAKYPPCLCRKYPWRAREIPTNVCHRHDGWAYPLLADLSCCRKVGWLELLVAPGPQTHLTNRDQVQVQKIWSMVTPLGIRLDGGPIVFRSKYPQASQ